MPPPRRGDVSACFFTGGLLISLWKVLITLVKRSVKRLQTVITVNKSWRNCVPGPRTDCHSPQTRPLRTRFFGCPTPGPPDGRPLRVRLVGAGFQPARPRSVIRSGRSGVLSASEGSGTVGNRPLRVRFRRGRSLTVPTASWPPPRSGGSGCTRHRRASGRLETVPYGCVFRIPHIRAARWTAPTDGCVFRIPHIRAAQWTAPTGAVDGISAFVGDGL